MTLPGVECTSADAILAKIADAPLETFGNSVRLAVWAGAAPANNESVGKRCLGRVRKGNPTLCATLAECAHGTARTQDTQF